MRKERPDIVIHIRADSAFGVPWMYDVCEKNGLLYTLGFSANPRLKRLTEGLLESASAQHEQTAEKARLFECFNYQCDSWPHPRTVIAKAECHEGGTNRRFIVTNLTSSCPLDRTTAGPVEPSPIVTAAQGEATYDQPCTWQLMLIKVAAIVVQTSRRIVVKVAANWPWWPLYVASAARANSINPIPALCVPSS
jgi:hypothetical protein